MTTEPKDSLGDRMKRNYEDRFRFMLPRRTFTIIRCDGKAFHTYTRSFRKPYDLNLVSAMDAAAMALCRAAQGSAFAYVQSDEISVLLTDFSTVQTDAWFDGNVQKICSVSASIVTAAFGEEMEELILAADLDVHGPALFDARVFSIPDPIEVENYFIWRQQDATRNSVSGLAQACFSHKQLHGVSNSGMQEMLFKEKGINWNDLPADQKRGRTIVYGDEKWSVDAAPPIFTQDRTYLKTRIPTRQD